jgi:ABC-type transport system substrate-binding protein
LIPPLSNSWYDTIVWNPIYNGLTEPWPTLNQAAGDFNAPALLTSWNISSDGFTWTLNCRQNVTWHDGENFTADDVVFSMWALMNPETGSQFVGSYQSAFGDKVTFTYTNGTSVTLGDGSRVGNIAATDQNTVVATLPVLADGKPYGLYTNILDFYNNIIPMHIFEDIPVADWSTCPLNTGQDSITIKGQTYTGPVGTGPYKWVSFDPTSQLVHIQRYDHYWNASGLDAMGVFKIKDYYIQYVADKTGALANLKNGVVDMLDYNYNMQTDVPSIDSSWGKVLDLSGCGSQELGFNMQHPVFGTGLDTPAGKADPSKAAEAAADVRIAFDYAIPKQLIIDNLLAGYGDPGVTFMKPTQPYYDTSLTARPYDLDQARHYLQLAGYSPPGANALNKVNLEGTLTYANGTAKTQYPIDLRATTDNSTYTASLQLVTQLTTSGTGAWSFTVTPFEPATYYYYLFDNSTGTPEYTFLQSFTVAGASPTPTATEEPEANNTFLYVAVAVVVIIVVIAAVLLLMRRKPMKA